MTVSTPISPAPGTASDSAKRLALIAYELLRLAQGESERAEQDPAIFSPEAPERFHLLVLARRTQTRRRLRQRFFPKNYLGEIAFDMLLSLYINEDHREDCITTLMAELGAPMTTMLRWLAHLEREARVIGKQDVKDARTRLISLTDKGRTEMDEYFRESLREVGSEY